MHDLSNLTQRKIWFGAGWEAGGRRCFTDFLSTVMGRHAIMQDPNQYDPTSPGLSGPPRAPQSLHRKANVSPAPRCVSSPGLGRNNGEMVWSPEGSRTWLAHYYALYRRHPTGSSSIPGKGEFHTFPLPLTDHQTASFVH